MTLKTQKIISVFLVGIVSVGAFQALIYILNLDQPALFFQVGVYVSIYLGLKIFLIYDLHFKKPGSFARAKRLHESVPHKLTRFTRVLSSTLWDRCTHLRKWEFFSRWFSYLLLPTFIFWSTLGIFYTNLGYLKIQEIVAAISSMALIVNYWYLKEVFARDKEKVDNDVFVVLSMVKIYTSAIIYCACLSLVRYYCLDSSFLTLSVFALTFLLIYQALFQHNLVSPKNLITCLLISLVMSVAAYFVLMFWGYNNFTAAVFLAAVYNLMWGVFHYHLDKSLSSRALVEILVISALIAGMLISVTNFKARLLDGCEYRIELKM